MKKIISVLIVALLLGFAVTAQADQPASGGWDFMSENSGPNGISAPTLIVPVRYGLWGTSVARIDPSLSSGDAVVWNTTSADGFTISACILDSATESIGFAGVLITSIQTADSAKFDRGSRNWGYMAVEGYCLAKIDSTGATAGQPLFVNGATLTASLATEATTTRVLSRDIGVLLKAPDATDGLAPVWLR